MRTTFFDGMRPRRAASFGLAVAVVVSVWLSLGSVAAFAESHPVVEHTGFETNTFSNPNGIAVDEASGDVYVADIGTDTIYKFSANGNPVDFSAVGLGSTNELTGSGTPDGSFSFPSLYGSPAAIAVDNACAQRTPALTGKACEESDPSAGDLYVMDAGHGVIDKFSPSGEYISQITGFTPSSGSTENELLGLGVDASGTLHVASRKSSVGKLLIEEFDDATTNGLVAHQKWEAWNAGAGVGIPGEPPADGFAVSPTGDDYPVYQPSCSCTVKFGQQLSPLGRVDKGEAGDVAVAVDPATGHLYADDQSSVAEWDTGAMNQNSTTNRATGEFEQAAGTLTARFGSAVLSSFAGQGGIAVDGASGQIYVSNPANGKVYVFSSGAPTVTASEPMGVTRETASLSGTVDPRGVAVSSCEFQWGLTDEFGNGPYDHSVPCAQTPAEIGTGSAPVAVSAQLEGLEAGELYHFRLVATNANGAGEGSTLLATQGLGFGIKNFEISFLNEDGTPDTQAGSHPFHFVDTFEMNSHFKRRESNADSPYTRMPDGVLRDVTVSLPPGLVGDPNATARKCTGQELRPWPGLCPGDSTVGELQLGWGAKTERASSFSNVLFNMVPPHGEALQLGTNFFIPLLFINNGVRAGGDYPVQATVTDAPEEAPVIRSRVVLNGVVTPCVVALGRSGKYNDFACREPAGAGGGEFEKETSRSKAFLTLPTGCHGPLRSTMMADSWEKPGGWVQRESVTHNAAGTPVSLTGCSKLKFPPTITISPDTTNASTSSGLTVGVHIPQNAALNPNGLAESSLRDTTVTLPQGVAINPSGSDGLEACSEDLAGFLGFRELNPEYESRVQTATFTPELGDPLEPGRNFCPNGSKIGTVKVSTPLLEHELEGTVYLAAQTANPFGSLLAMYLIVEDPYSGSLIKLTGELTLSDTGQITTTFENTPDLPFENLEMHFFGGERAPLSTPARCGTYTTEAVFTPWDGNGPVHSTSSFQIDHGPGGGPCPGQSLPFAPALTAGAPNVQAGGFTPFTMTMSRPDGSQNLDAITLHMPPGLSGTLKGVELCPEPRADEGLCGPNSQIGETTISVGVGNDPFTVTGGTVYLTGPYEGAPYGLSIVNPAKAGPFDLESTPAKHPACDCLVVRAKIEVDPTTAALTVTSDTTGPYRIPTMLEGIPLQIQHVNVSITRQNFTFNPTNCAPMAITGSLTSSEGATDALSVPFQVTNCGRLSFKPSFTVGTSAHTSRTNGASLDVKLDYPSAPFGTQTNLAKVKVELPKQLPSRLTTLQKACVDTVFDQNPANCPAASRVGEAVATTPILPVPLSGPAYFVSHGGAKFPELIIVLSGYGTTVELHGETFIDKAGITSSTFGTVPDLPVSTFELKLPEKPDSALAANGDLCAQKMVMPTSFTAQNGAVIKQKTPIHVEGCRPAIRVLHHKVAGKWATVVVSVPSAGQLVADGGGVMRTTKRIHKAGTVTLKLRLSKAEQRFVAHHHGRRLRVPIKLSFKPARGKNLHAIVAVLMR